MNLSSEKLVSKLAFKFNLFHYSTAEMRLSWLHSKLGDELGECEAINEPGQQHRWSCTS
jgi:hypothetical protein